MSLRRFGVILQSLPSDSQYKTAVRDSGPIDWDNLPEPDPDVHGPWSETNLLLASLVDQVARARWDFSDRKTPPPDPVRRPGVVTRNKVTPISPQAAAYLDYLREHQGAAPPPDWNPAV